MHIDPQPDPGAVMRLRRYLEDAAIYPNVPYPHLIVLGDSVVVTDRLLADNAVALHFRLNELKDVEALCRNLGATITGELNSGAGRTAMKIAVLDALYLKLTYEVET